MKNIYKDIEAWINKISKVQKSGQSICPYASKAKFKIFTEQTIFSLSKLVKNFDTEYDLYICIYHDSNIPYHGAEYWETWLNHISNNTITLLDHHKNPGYIDGVNTGNEKYVIYLIQNKESLLEARKHLHTTNYYNNWSKEYYEKITEIGV